MEKPVLSPEDAKCPKQIMSTGEDTSPGQALPDNLPSHVKFYNRESQEKYFPCGRIFSYFPACVNEQGWFWPSALRCGHFNCFLLKEHSGGGGTPRSA